ncbi:ComF family protein [Streptomyces sp. NPDC020379]|uniref:ComF family protein n=1 Tax=Streptomyces sp. NPDC020379 TaxID=3365071 RepID=UPI0037A70E21
MRRWWQEITGLVLPVDCAGCGRWRTVLCEECRAALSGSRARRVWPDPVPVGLPPVHAAARYGDRVRSVLLAHKERGALALAGPLGAALAGAVRAVVEGADGGEGEVGRGGGGPLLLVPVPSARHAVAARGHDPGRRIALAAAGVLRRAGLPARTATVLRQRRAVADQAGLDARQRRANVSDALGVLKGAEGLLCQKGPVVLVDDLMTTGASLSEAARAVSLAGGRLLGAAVVATVERTPAEPAPRISGTLGERHSLTRETAGKHLNGGTPR